MHEFEPSEGHDRQYSKWKSKAISGGMGLLAGGTVGLVMGFVATQASDKFSSYLPGIERVQTTSPEIVQTPTQIIK